MSDNVSLTAVVHGHVQGVYFRSFVQQKAGKLGLTGYALNLPSGRDVEVCAEGERKQVEKLLDHLWEGPPIAKVEEVKTTWSKYSGGFTGFAIR
ncbi:MAG: acylphosphatase [Dehalococcoidales bacterium]|nr:acylphosphatase [Dehalococcoidales bacterium]